MAQAQLFSNFMQFYIRFLEYKFNSNKFFRKCDYLKKQI